MLDAAPPPDAASRACRCPERSRAGTKMVSKIVCALVLARLAAATGHSFPATPLGAAGDAEAASARGASRCAAAARTAMQNKYRAALSSSLAAARAQAPPRVPRLLPRGPVL